MDSSNLKFEVEEFSQEQLRPLALKAEPGEVKAETEVQAEISLATIRGKSLEPKEDPGIAGCPLAFDHEAQLVALAPVAEEDEEEPEEPAASQAPRVASISATPFKREERTEEPAPPGEEPEEDPFGLGPRRSRSPPASRAQLRSIAATASQKPRKKTAFYPSR